LPIYLHGPHSDEHTKPQPDNQTSDQKCNCSARPVPSLLNLRSAAWPTMRSRVLSSICSTTARCRRRRWRRPASSWTGWRRRPIFTRKPIWSGAPAECSSSVVSFSPGSPSPISQGTSGDLLWWSPATSTDDPSLVVCCLGSVLRSAQDMVPLAATRETGPTALSVVRFDKRTTLDRSVVTGKLGSAPGAG